MEKKKAIHFYGTFEGLYEWGKGWKSEEVMNKWNYWWKNEFPKLHTGTWENYIEPKYIWESGRLVSLSASIYMHPMGIHGTLTEGELSCSCCLPEENCKYDYRYVFYDQLKELSRICTAVAEYCGGTFTLDTTREFDIEIPDERFVLNDRADYMHNCAERKERFDPTKNSR